MTRVWVWLAVGALAFTLQADDSAKTKSKAIEEAAANPLSVYEWLDGHSDPPAVNVSGTWTEKRWKTVILRQREGSAVVTGTGGGWNVEGVVSGNKLYALFVSGAEIGYCAELTVENSTTIQGAYSDGAVYDSAKTRPTLLTKAGPPPDRARSANTKAKNPQTVEVAEFDMRPGIGFTRHHRAALSEEVVEALTKTGLYRKVTATADMASGEKADIRVTGTITELNVGIAALQRWVGWGAGLAFVRVRVKFVDTATEKVKQDQEVEAQLTSVADPFYMAQGIGKQIVNVAKGKKPEVVERTGPKYEVEGKRWLDSKKGVVEISVDGTWHSPEWGKVVFSQKEGTAQIVGTGDSWNVDGIVSGKNVYLVFSSRGVIGYTAELTFEDAKKLNGGYVKGMLKPQAKTKAIVLER
jgi:hypothetical protein